MSALPRHSCLCPFLVLSALLSFTVFPVASSDNKTEAANAMFEDYWRWRLFISPTLATSFGFHDAIYASRLPALTEHEIETRERVCEAFLKRSHVVDEMEGQLDEQTALSLKLFNRDIQDFLKGLPFQAYYLGGVTNLGGPHRSFAGMVNEAVLETEVDYQHLFSRLSSMPRYIQQHIDFMKKGIEINMTHSEYTINGVTDQIDGLIDKDQAYEYAFGNISESIPEERHEDIQKKGRFYLDELVYPSFQKLKTFIQDTYMKHLRSGIGLSSIPNGTVMYEELVKYYTNTDMSPLQVHQRGLRQVQHVLKQYKKVMTDMGYPHLRVSDFGDMLRNDSSLLYPSKEAVVEDYEDVVYNQIDPKLSTYFRNLPKQKLLIQTNDDPNDGGAYYSKGSFITGRPGKFIIATANYKSMEKHWLTTLSMHEANPGHHLHFSLLQENEELPNFRKYPHTALEPPSDFPGYVGFVEGWAHYAESLGYEMGLYNDNLQRFGHLSSSILHATRLVVDTGMHVFGWSRDQAIEYMLHNSPLSRDYVTVEVNRYITLPAQSLSYNIGASKMHEFRQRAKDALAEKFHIKDFHDVVMNCFGPFDILQECVDTYIQKKFAAIR